MCKGFIESVFPEEWYKGMGGGELDREEKEAKQCVSSGKSQPPDLPDGGRKLWSINCTSELFPAGGKRVGPLYSFPVGRWPRAS